MQGGMGKRLVVWLATGLGLGYAPVASGTFGTLLGIPLAAALTPLPWWGQALGVLLLVAAAVPVCSAAERVFGKKDDGRIVMDEYVTLPLCLIGIPWAAEPGWLLAGFLLHRVLDIIKPAPARQAQAIPHGPGIVLDDVISSLYALALMHGLYWGVTAW